VVDGVTAATATPLAQVSVTHAEVPWCEWRLTPRHVNVAPEPYDGGSRETPSSGIDGPVVIDQFGILPEQQTDRTSESDQVERFGRAVQDDDATFGHEQDGGRFIPVSHMDSRCSFPG
jgi:hypothetical protein